MFTPHTSGPRCVKAVVIASWVYVILFKIMFSCNISCFPSCYFHSFFWVAISSVPILLPLVLLTWQIYLKQISVLFSSLSQTTLLLPLCIDSWFVPLSRRLPFSICICHEYPPPFAKSHFPHCYFLSSFAFVPEYWTFCLFYHAYVVENLENKSHTPVYPTTKITTKYNISWRLKLRENEVAAGVFLKDLTHFHLKVAVDLQLSTSHRGMGYMHKHSCVLETWWMTFASGYFPLWNGKFSKQHTAILCLIFSNLNM